MRLLLIELSTMYGLCLLIFIISYIKILLKRIKFEELFLISLVKGTVSPCYDAVHPHSKINNIMFKTTPNMSKEAETFLKTLETRNSNTFKEDDIVILIPTDPKSVLPPDNNLYLVRFKHNHNYSNRDVDVLKGSRVNDYKNLIVCWYQAIKLDSAKFANILASGDPIHNIS